MDCFQNTVEQIAADSDFRELERDGAGMADDARTDFDQPGLQAGQ